MFRLDTKKTSTRRAFKAGNSGVLVINKDIKRVQEAHRQKKRRKKAYVYFLEGSLVVSIFLIMILL